MLWSGALPLGAFMPPPRREDMPDDPTHADIIFEVRTGRYYDDLWRAEAKPALDFAARSRAVARFLAMAVPVVTVIAIAWMAR